MIKKFILNSVSTLATCFGVLVLLHLFYACREYNRFILPRGRSIMALSNSHTQCALSDENWPEFMNLSTSGSSPWIWHWKLKTLIDRNPKDTVKCIVLSFGVVEATRQDSPKAEIESFARYFPMGLIGGTYPYPIRSTLFSKTFWDTYMEKFFSFRGVTQKWADPPPPDTTKDFDAKKTIQEHFGHDTSSLAESNSTYLSNLTSMIELALNNDIQVVLISTPCFKAYRCCVPQFIVNRRDELIEMLTTTYPNVQYLDFYDTPSLNRADFCDAHHLSSSGRRKLTPLVKAEIERHSTAGHVQYLAPKTNH